MPASQGTGWLTYFLHSHISPLYWELYENVLPIRYRVYFDGQFTFRCIGKQRFDYSSSGYYFGSKLTEVRSGDNH